MTSLHGTAGLHARSVPQTLVAHPHRLQQRQQALMAWLPEGRAA